MGRVEKLISDDISNKEKLKCSNSGHLKNMHMLSRENIYVFWAFQVIHRDVNKFVRNPSLLRRI